MTTVSHLECSLCGKRLAAGEIWNRCECGGPLLVRYDLEQARKSWNRGWVNNGPSTMWRYQPVLPVRKPESIVTLGEGFTPLVPVRGLARRLGCSRLWVKDEGVNPTGTLKARGMSCAVSMAREFGIRKIAVPSAGNAASALAAYSAAAGVEAHLFMPRDVPQANYIEGRAYGARVTLVDGLISDCERIVSEGAVKEGWFDVSSLKEPYRVEGKKTMGYEIAEQLHWEAPDVVLCPTGDGVGLVGLWKAFGEMGDLGWTSGKRPKMVAVQASGCQPLVRAFDRGDERADLWENARTIASGLRVPEPTGSSLVLSVVRESGGCVVGVDDADLIQCGIQLAADEGVFPAPEGGACVAALRKLLANGFLTPNDSLVIVNTGSGLKYQEAYRTRFHKPMGGEADKLGGLITPR